MLEVQTKGLKWSQQHSLYGMFELSGGEFLNPYIQIAPQTN